MNGDWLVVVMNKVSGDVHSLRCNTQNAAAELGKWFTTARNTSGQDSHAVFSCHDPKRSDPL